MAMENEAGNADKEKERRLDLRTEYSALVSNFNYILTFRFTLLGLFLAAVGLLLGRATPPPIELYPLLILLTCAVYIIELRTRTLYQTLRERGAQIEFVEWGQSKGKELEGFFGRQLIELPKYIKDAGIDAAKVQPERFPFILFWQLRLTGKILNHSFGLDIIYLGIITYSLLSIVRFWLHL